MSAAKKTIETNANEIELTEEQKAAAAAALLALAGGPDKPEGTTAPETSENAPTGSQGTENGSSEGEDPAPDAKPSNVIDFSKFTLAVDEDIAIDEGAAIARETDLPFKAFFSDNFAKAVSGGHPSSYCPLGFIQHRSDAYQKKVGKPLKTVKHGDVRSKVADQFKAWQGDDAGRKAVKLQYANRTGHEENDKGAQQMGPGVRFWLVKA